MKKTILAVILLAAAGGATYYFLQENKKTSQNSIQKELIVGKWKMDSLKEGKDSAGLFVGIMGMVDSNLLNYDYDFQKNGNILRLLKDSVQKDTSYYEWTKDNALLWKEEEDSTAQPLTITKLTIDSLVLQTKDSTVIYFKKIKELSK